MLRLVGNRFGPVLRSRPAIDSVAAQMAWSESMDQLAAVRKAPRFVREPEGAESAERDVLRR